MNKIPIAGYEELYWITKDAKVYSRYRELKPQTNPKTGYKTVGLIKDKKQKNIAIHRLMALTFLPPSKNKTQVNHINSIKTDNRLENLEWCTASENAIHSWKYRYARINNDIGLPIFKSVK
jgi:hypothetical protein